MDRARGAGTEPSSESRDRQVRLVALILATLVLLGALPLYFGIRAATRDPVFNSLDELAVPEWASREADDLVSGSRWCFLECRLRERSAQSERAPAETTQVYQAALAADGWQRWNVVGCPEQPVQGDYTCWRRDELTLDLWVRDPTCAADPLVVRPTDEAVPLADASVAPAEPSADCGGASVSIKVNNAINDGRSRPQPSVDPSLVGETPDATFTDDPLLDLTTAPS